MPLRYLFASKDGLHSVFRDPDAGPGAPKGLLGLRGDGISSTPIKLNMNNRGGFSENPDGQNKRNEFPKGLSLNPRLVNAQQKRLEKVNRKIQRQDLRNNFSDRFESGSSTRSPQRSLSAKEEKRERERLLRSEMRRSVPSLPFLLKRLEQKNLLPAIVSLFDGSE